MEMKRREFLARSIAEAKLIGEGTFRDGDEKRDKSVRYVLGSGSVDAMESRLRENRAGR
jgi:hypothetical protein